MMGRLLEQHGDCQEYKILRRRIRDCETVQTLAVAGPSVLVNLPKYDQFVQIVSPYSGNFPVDLKLRLTAAHAMRAHLARHVWR